MPRADFVLFITSADRPFTETERAFVEAIRAWGKKVVVVVNRIDIFERTEDVEQVTSFVASAAESVLGDAAADLSGQRAAGLARQARRADAVAGEPIRSD